MVHKNLFLIFTVKLTSFVIIFRELGWTKNIATVIVELYGINMTMMVNVLIIMSKVII